MIWKKMPAFPKIEDFYAYIDEYMDSEGNLRLPDRAGNPGLQKAFDQQDEVARFLSDVGAAMESRYVLRKAAKPEDFQGTYTSSFLRKSDTAFKEVFFYENAEMNAIGYGRFDCGTSLNESDFKKAAIPSLDRGTPVIVDLKGKWLGGSNVGHVVIVDGYGYDKKDRSRILFHVLMGHSGEDDGWYELFHEKVGID